MLEWVAIVAGCAVLLAPSARTGADDAAWERVAPAPVVRGTLVLAERPGSELAARGAQLFRRSEGREIEIACTLAGGPGEIRDLALDPAGLVFIAAERDVFVLGPDVAAIDPLRWKDGAPRGSPTSVHVDAKRRVWIATDREIGVVEPSFYWGRVLRDSDGLPGAGPYRLKGEATGALLVECASGVFRYHPDRGPKPAVTALAIDGETWTSDRTHSKPYGGELAIAVEGRAAGGASFRYRFDGHHVWRELGATIALEKLSPGNHTLDVVAIDRDLGRSNPARVKLAVEYPRYYDKRLLLPAAMGAGALTTALFLVRARRQGGGAQAWLRGLASAGVVLVIGIQIVAGLVPHAKGWPFIGFSMYSNTYEEGSIIYDGVLTGLERDGRPRRLDFNALGHLADDRWQVLQPIIDGGAPVAREWVEAFNARYPDARIFGLQARADRRCLTPTGAVEIAPLILSSYVHQAADGGK